MFSKVNALFSLCKAEKPFPHFSFLFFIRKAASPKGGFSLFRSSSPPVQKPRMIYKKGIFG